MSSFFEVLSAREDHLAVGKEKVATFHQLTLARRSFEVGTKAITDVREAEARHDLATAKAVDAESTLESRRQSLAELVSVENLQLRVLPAEGMPPKRPHLGLAPLTSEAVAADASVRECRQRLDAARIGIQRARAGHLPTLDLSVRYGPEYSTGTTPNPVRTHGRTSQIEANLTMPLFAGFTTREQAREAEATAEKTGAECLSAERRVRIELRDAHTGLIAALAKFEALTSAVRSSEASVRANRRGYEVGVNTNAEVLDAEARAIEIQRDFGKAKLDAWMYFLKLHTRIGSTWQIAIREFDEALIIESSHPSDSSRTPPAYPETAPAAVRTSGASHTKTRFRIDTSFDPTRSEKSEQLDVAKNATP